MARSYFSTVLVLTLFVSFVTCQTTTVPQEFTEGESLSITCNADTAEVPSSFTQITTAQLLQVKATGDEEMAFIQQRDGTANAISRQGSGFFSWTITIPTQGDLETQLSVLTNNRDSMAITVTKSAAQCSDGGIFKCIVAYVGANTEAENEARDFNYTGVSRVAVQEMTIVPFESGAYTENTTVTLKCTASGPENHEFRWQRSCPPPNSLLLATFVSWPTSSDIQEKTSFRNEPSDCDTYSHIQELIFTTRLEDDNCVIRCQFGSMQNGFIVDGSSNLTILVKEAEVSVVTETVTTNSTSADTAGKPDPSTSASNESLAIGLGVGLSLLVIIIIVILVYIFYCRKRNKDDKYKSDGQDNPDANNLGSSPPHPVFYSKPNKQAKSERNDARGASIGSEDSYPYEKDIRRKPYFDEESQGLDTDPHGPPRYGRRRSNRRSRGDSVDDSDKEQPRRYPYDQRRSYGDDPRHDDYNDSQPYASTDISRSEDELSDASGRPRPRPKRRTKYTPKDGEEKELHYADLDIPQRQANNNRDDERNERGFESRDPIHYASIRV